jgi:hypothetical protein
VSPSAHSEKTTPTIRPIINWWQVKEASKSAKLPPDFKFEDHKQSADESGAFRILEKIIIGIPTERSAVINQQKGKHVPLASALRIFVAQHYRELAYPCP